MIRVLMSCALAITFLIGAGQACAAWEAELDDKKQVKAAKAIAAIQDRIPASEKYFEDAYGFAILPSVTRLAVGFGGAYGGGIVVEGEEVIGTTGFWQFTSGIQGGVRNFSMILFFKDKQALDHYKTGSLQFLGQAGITLLTVGVVGTPAYNEGVAIVTVTRLGLMFELSYSGARFTYKPLIKD